MKIRLLIVVFVLLVFNCGSSKSESEIAAESEAFTRITELINSSNFRFKATVAFPFQSRAIIDVSNAVMRQTQSANGRFPLNDDNDFIEIKNDSAIANLTYFGELRVAAYSDVNNPSVEFDARYQNYQVKVNEKKKTITVSFSVINENERFNVKMLFFPNGNGNTVIYGSNRTTIRYDGELTALTDFEI